MFFDNQEKDKREQYQQFLEIVGSLSNLFSNSNSPYLYYRIAEKIFCRAFNANDLSRSDVSADAKKEALGIGLKTFLSNNNQTFQKIAEFNSSRGTYITLPPEELVQEVARLRNNRIDFTEKIHSLDQSIYHCVVRDKNRFKIFEESMDRINIEKITGVKRKKNSISFNDELHEYSFLLSKSTLTKRFKTTRCLFEFDVMILKDPLIELQKCLFKKDSLEFQKCLSKGDSFDFQGDVYQQTIFLPLYGKNKTVYKKSGLNQWNARGRKRDPDEVYIPVPRLIHINFPDFFPDRETSFELVFPDGEKVPAKICQEGGKALMTKSNRKLGKLILRDGLKLKEGELATYEKLQLLGIDSVRIDKINETTYEINFAKTNSYEAFFT